MESVVNCRGWKCNCRAAALLLLVFLLLSCTHEKPIAESHYDKVVLFYLDGNNNLSTDIGENLDDIVSGSYIPLPMSNEALFVYIQKENRVPQIEPYEQPTLLRLVNVDGRCVKLVEKIFDFKNSCEDSSMSTVLSYVANNYPANENGLIISSHGTGYLPCFYHEDPNRFKLANNNLKMAALASVEEGNTYDILTTGTRAVGDYIKTNAGVDIKDFCNLLPIRYDYVIFDCCLMGGVEVAYQLRNKADKVVFSQAEIPAKGMVYDKMCAALFATGGADLMRVCQDYYNREYDGQIIENQSSIPTTEMNSGATISLIDLSGMESLAAICNKILSYAGCEIPYINANNLQEFFRHWTPQRNFFYDLSDFVEELVHLADSDHSDDIAMFNSALDDVVLYSAHTNWFMGEIELKKNCGLSVYVPLNYAAYHPYLNNYYKTLDWSIATYGAEGEYFPY